MKQKISSKLKDPLESELFRLKQKGNLTQRQSRDLWIKCYKKSRRVPDFVLRVFAEWVEKYHENDLTSHPAKINDRNAYFNKYYGRRYEIYRYVNLIVRRAEITKREAMQKYVEALGNRKYQKYKSIPQVDTVHKEYYEMQHHIKKLGNYFWRTISI